MPTLPLRLASVAVLSTTNFPPLLCNSSPAHLRNLPTYLTSTLPQSHDQHHRRTASQPASQRGAPHLSDSLTASTTQFLAPHTFSVCASSCPLPRRSSTSCSPPAVYPCLDLQPSPSLFTRVSHRISRLLRGTWKRHDMTVLGTHVHVHHVHRSSNQSINQTR